MSFFDYLTEDLYHFVVVDKSGWTSIKSYRPPNHTLLFIKNNIITKISSNSILYTFKD